MDRVLGIDLGTTNSVVAYYEQGQAIVIQNSEGFKTTPSVVFYKSPDEIIVGELAKRQAVTHPKAAIRSVKRFMGARYSEIGEKRKGISYDLIPGPDDSILIDVGWAQVSPEQVSAEILKKMKSTAEDYFGEPVSKAVVTVPAYFNDNQRSATKRAGELAGLDVVRIINEPTAAALAYGVDKKIEQRIAVFDLGGGTFDVSILELDRDVFEVKATRGDTFLGGDNIDELIYNEAVSRFRRETGVDLEQDLQAVQRLREAAEKVKCELSSAQETLFSLPFIAAGADGPLHVSYPIDRASFNLFLGPLLPTLTECCSAAVKDSQLKIKDITNVLLVGGSTRIPAIQNLAKEYFGRDPNKSLNPDEAVAIGAAIQGSIMSGGLREVLLLDVTPLSLGIELADGGYGVIIPRNSSIPTSAMKNFTTVRDNQSSVKIHVLQGERKIASQNHTLGHFRLLGITPAPKEIPAINVSFQIDANGILHVAASDATSGVSNSISIETYSQISPEEASAAILEAEEKVEEDRAFMRRKYVRLQADHIISQLETLASSVTDPLGAETVKAIREAAFKFDLAYSSKVDQDIEAAFENLKTLATQYNDRLLEIKLHGS